MKKIRLGISAFLIFLLSFCFFSSKTYAVTENLSATSSSTPEINYELPYPGLLPDSPLYFFRAIRDRIVGLLISDPLKKAEFDLLQADKRLNAGIYLFNKGKTSLAFSTVSKAENYFLQALDKVEEAKKQGENINDLKGKLKNAVEKHEQELSMLSEKSGADFKSGFEKELKRIMDFEDRLSK
jgi:hypothetical protein